MHNMTNMNPLSYICIICTPHFAEAPAKVRVMYFRIMSSSFIL